MTRGLSPAGSTRAWRRLRLAVLERDGWVCQVPVDAAGRITPAGRPCGQPATTADHIVPRVLGGLDTLANLRAACQPHNLAKAGRLDADAAEPVQPPPRRRGPYRRPPVRARPWAW